MATSRIIAERILYFGLIGLFVFSLVLFLGRGNWEGAWEIYSHVYFWLLLMHTWFVFILLFIGDRQKKRISPFALKAAQAGKIAVVIPCYNESAELLYKAIRSVILADGDKEIIVIDDGSTHTQSRRLLQVFAAKMNVTVHFFERNQGKRHAIHHAVKNMITDADYVVTIDSDTVLDKQALMRLVSAFADPKVGAATGDVQLLNEKKNLLTRMVGTYYWIGLHIYKQAQSTAGMVVCCSGCLAAYRANLLRSIIDEFVDQTFFGEPCTHSEDRHLTNLILRGNWHVKYVPDAVCFTETPSTIRGFLKQQQRWKRGFVRESIFTLTYAWRSRPLLFFEILLWDLTIPFFSFGLMLTVFISIFTNPAFLAVLIPSWIVFMFVRYLPIVFYGRQKIFGLFVYMIFYDVFLYWQSIYALFTVRNKSWITR